MPEQLWFGRVIALFTAIQGTIMIHGAMIIATEVMIRILNGAVDALLGRQAGIEASVGEIIAEFTGVMTGDADAKGLMALPLTL